MSEDLAGAYDRAAAAWQAGPARLYDRLAEVLVGRVAVPLHRRRVLDVGAGTGAVSRAVVRAGGRPIACDLAPGMLDARPRPRAPAAVSDARRLPLRTHSVDAVIAAFSLNHVPDPDRALAEARRVTTPGGAILASAYSDDDDHAVKHVVRRAAEEMGWTPEPWWDDLRERSIPVLGTLAGATAAAVAAGIDGAGVHEVAVPFPEVGPEELLAWRLGMPEMAPFVAALPARDRAALHRRARQLLGDPAPLVRRIVVISALC